MTDPGRGFAERRPVTSDERAASPAGHGHHGSKEREARGIAPEVALQHEAQ